MKIIDIIDHFLSEYDYSEDIEGCFYIDDEVIDKLDYFIGRQFHETELTSCLPASKSKQVSEYFKKHIKN